MTHHPSERKDSPGSVAEVHQLRSVQAAEQILNAPPKPETTGRGETKPKYHNPYKGMKI